MMSVLIGWLIGTGIGLVSALYATRHDRRRHRENVAKIEAKLAVRYEAYAAYLERRLKERDALVVEVKAWCERTGLECPKHIAVMLEAYDAVVGPKGDKTCV